MNLSQLLTKYRIYILAAYIFMAFGLFVAYESLVDFDFGYQIFMSLAVAPLIMIAIAVFLIPTIIAKNRGHVYTNIILVLNLAGAVTVVTWFIALAWAVFPSEKSLIEPIVGNPTGTGRRNAGDTVGSAKIGVQRGERKEMETDRLIDELIELRTKGLINDEEFKRKKIEILQRGDY